MKHAFMNAQEMSKEKPENFKAPSEEDLSNLKREDFVKIGICGERFWSEITSITGKEIKGLVSNDLQKTREHGLKLLDEIQYTTDNVLNVLVEPSFVTGNERYINVRLVHADCNKTIMIKCNFCGQEKNEQAFKTDVLARINKDEMTCENCYDSIDNNEM